MSNNNYTDYTLKQAEASERAGLSKRQLRRYNLPRGEEGRYSEADIDRLKHYKSEIDDSQEKINEAKELIENRRKAIKKYKRRANEPSSYPSTKE